MWGVLKEEFKQPFHRLSISTNIDRFRQVDKCRSHQCIIIKLPYLSWEKKHPRLIISCQDRMIWYDERTEFFLFKREVIEWTVSACWNSAHCIIIAIVVEALAAGLASMTILAHEIIKQNFQHCCSSPNVYGDLYGHMFFDFRVKL